MIFQGNPHVWVSLSDVTVSLVLEKITSSAMVEGLWLCRRHQLKDQQQVNRTVVYLDLTIVSFFLPWQSMQVKINTLYYYYIIYIGFPRNFE